MPARFTGFHPLWWAAGHLGQPGKPGLQGGDGGGGGLVVWRRRGNRLRWMKEPEFDAAYREARRSAFGQSISRLQQASSAAVTTVLKLMVDPNAPASTRLRAAEIVLDKTARAIELDDLDVRLSELERAAEQRPRL
jgi:hypothetical protein